MQRATLTVLEPLGEAIFHDCSFGFRYQLTLDMALSKVRELVRKGDVWLGDADIKGCFDNIPYEPVLKGLYKLCGDKAVVNLVRHCIRSQPDRFRPGGKGRGLPQGNYSKSEGLDSTSNYSKSEGLDSTSNYSKSEGLNSILNYSKSEGLNSILNYSKSEGLDSILNFSKSEGLDSILNFSKSEGLDSRA